MIVEFTPDNELEQTLVRAATDPAARPEFYRRLLAAELYILTDEAPAAPGETSRPAAADAGLITWESPTGPYVPLFSSRARVDEIARLRERSYGFVALSGKAAFARLAQEKRAAFLNPGFACGKQFVPDVIDRLAGGEKAVPAATAAGATTGPESIAEGAESKSKKWWKIW
ncbi:MAG TPA: SseB family protein [Polyangia bacterium]